MIGETISHYKILEKLGEGGMGVVYKAEDTKLRRVVALKCLPTELVRDPEAKRRFVNEAQTASGLQHHNICTIHEIDETPDGRLFICMDCYEGETLKQKIARGPLQVVEAVGIAMQVAEGLARAHQAGMVHRDIKPANVIVTNEGMVKIVDFGLAKLVDRTKLTRTGTTVGTPAYMSPEQVRGGDVDPRADIWSLGVVLYELVTGQLPFRGEHIQAMLYSILNEEPEPVTSLRTGVPMELERVITRCVEKNAEDRYQTADDLVSDLRRVQRMIAEPGTRSRSAAISSEAARPGRRRSWMAALAVIAVIAVIALLPYFVPSEKWPGWQPAEGRKMLAVLPFKNLGPSEDDYFADGLTEEITSRLAAVHGLGVISRTSADQYKGTSKKIREIGDELGVDFVLEGTVRWDRASRGESRVRITPQLIKVSDDTHMWAETYDQVLDDIFAVQTEIAEQVFQQLDVTLLDPERRALETQPTRNFEAYEAYLRGLYYSWRAYESKEDGLLAVQMFERAVALDSTYAMAYTQLSLAYSLSYQFGHDRSEECLANAKAAVDRALELAPELPDAHLALGYYHYRGFRDYDLALEALEVAQKSLPNDAGMLEATGYIQRRQGNFDAALVSFLTGFELNPLSPHLARAVATTYFFMRRYEEADTYLDRSISLDPDQIYGYLAKAANYWYWTGDTEKARAVLEMMPHKTSPVVIESQFLQELLERDYTAALYRLSSTSIEIFESGDSYVPKALYEGLTYQLMGNPDQARASYGDARVVLEEALKERPDESRIHSFLGIAYAGLGRNQEAIREGKRAVELYPVSKDALGGPLRVMDLAYVYIMVGELDDAMDQIEYLLSIPNGSLSVAFLRLDPQVDPLRSHPRFQRLLEEYSAAGS